MAEDKLFKELLKPEILKIGWYLAQGDSRDDFVRDPVGHKDYAVNLSARLEFAIEQIQSQVYRPRYLIEVDVPKSALSVRPGNVLPIEEAAILHAAIYLLAPKLDRKLPANIYSYRLHKEWGKRASKGQSLFREVEIEVPFLKSQTIRSISLFDAWYERWPAFEEDAKKKYQNEGYSYLTKTDIFSFFEHIDLNYLQNLIRAQLKTKEEKLLQLIFTILNSWTRVTSTGMPINRGIPQGNEVSSFLGNLILIPLDHQLDSFCKSCGGWWARYVDDVKVYTRTENDARKAVFVINQALRQMHLNLQGTKTEILTGKVLEEEHTNTKLDAVNSAFENIQKLTQQNGNHAKQITAELKKISSYLSDFTRGVPQSVRGMKGKRNRLFRRLLTVYGFAKRTHKGLFEAVYAAISELPDLRVLKSCLAYLKKMDLHYHNDITQRLLKLLEDGSLPFPYQQASVLDTIVHLHPPKNIVSNISSWTRKFAMGPSLNKKSDWLVIQKAIELIAASPYNGKYINAISEHYCKHEHSFVRRAAVMILPRANCEVSKQLYALSRHPDSGVSRLAQYLLRLMTDKQYAQKELSDFKKMSQADNAIIRRIYILYALSSSTDQEIANCTYKTVSECFNKTKSAKMKWHQKELLDRTKWSLKTSTDGARNE